jgi:glycosyltransferase involved in cell wall biosynthesis
MPHKQINYSIIIPHKNIPRLLQRCLDSIPRRDDVQILVIDDNSDADKVDFKTFPGLNDPYVEVIFTKEGKGAGYARNVGLDKAKGKWLLFADADDYFNYCIREVFDEYKNKDTRGIVYFKNSSLDSAMYTDCIRHDSRYPNKIIDRFILDKNKYQHHLRYTIYPMWAKLISRELVESRRIRCDEIPAQNDVTFSYLSGFYAEQIDADARSLYCVTVRAGSLSTTYNKSRLNSLYVHAKKYRFHVTNRIGMDSYIRYRPILLLLKIFIFERAHYQKGIAILLNCGFTKRTIKQEIARYIFFIFPYQVYRWTLRTLSLFFRRGQP